MFLKDFRSDAHGVDDLLNYGVMLKEDQVLLMKDGSFLAAWWFAGPDLGSASHDEMKILTSQVNRALVNLGDGWLINCDCIRSETIGYPEGGHFPDATTRVIDEERRAQYNEGGKHYDSLYALTVTYLAPPDSTQKVADFFIEGGDEAPISWSQILELFCQKVNSLEDGLSLRLKMRRMDASELLTFLHYCLTGLRHPIRVPNQEDFYVDQLLATQDFYGGLQPRVGEKQIRTISINGFPESTIPGMLDFLNALPIEYR